MIQDIIFTRSSISSFSSSFPVQPWFECPVLLLLLVVVVVSAGAAYNVPHQRMCKNWREREIEIGFAGGRARNEENDFPKDERKWVKYIKGKRHEKEKGRRGREKKLRRGVKVREKRERVRERERRKKIIYLVSHVRRFVQSFSRVWMWSRGYIGTMEAIFNSIC